MTIEIGDLRPDDIEAVHDILTSPHVIRGTMRLPHQSLDYTRKRFEPTDGVITLAARSDGRLVGFSEMITYPNIPRHRHAAEINLVVTRGDWQGKGVGRALMEAMIDLADNWLNISRISLVVWTSNAPALHLYQSLGFEIEGTMPHYGFGQGEYIDAYQMGRVIRKP